MSIPAVFVAIVIVALGMGFGLPVGWAFILASIGGVFAAGQSLNFIATTFYQSMNNYVIMGAIFFIYAGALLGVSGLSDRLIRFSNAFVGRFRGGLTLVAIVTSAIMGALTGGTLTCVSALVPLMVPKLEKFGYKKEYSTTVIAASSFLGTLIPPSVPAMLYCLVANQSVAALFLSTVVPGLLLTLAYAIINFFMAPRYMEKPSEEAAMEIVALTKPEIRREKIESTFAALPAFGTIAIILGGIYGGFFTPNEAGAIAAVYTFVIGVWIYKEITVKNFKEATLSAAISAGFICLLMGAGTVFTRFMIRQGAAQALASFVLSIFDSKILILFAMNIFLLLLGMVLDTTPMMVLVVPLFLPLMNELGVNLVHLGAIAVFNIGIGTITPPYAIALFVGARLSDTPFTRLARPVLPFVLLGAIPVLLLLTYCPAVACWLPEVLLGPDFVGQWR